MRTPRFYILRFRLTGELFAGFRPTGKVGVFDPAFVMPAAGKSVQAQIIHEDDIEETESDLRKLNYGVDRVQVA